MTETVPSSWFDTYTVFVRSFTAISAGPLPVVVVGAYRVQPHVCWALQRDPSSTETTFSSWLV